MIKRIKNTEKIRFKGKLVIYQMRGLSPYLKIEIICNKCGRSIFTIFKRLKFLTVNLKKVFAIEPVF